MGSHSLLQGNLPNPGIEPVLHWQVGYLPLSHQGSPTRLSGLLINVVGRDAKGRTHRPTLLAVTPGSLHDRLTAALQARSSVGRLPGSFCKLLSMLDTQDAQVMPEICRKHFFGAAVMEAGRDLGDWRGPWLVWSPTGWGVPPCTGTGAPAAACPMALPAPWFPTRLLEHFSRTGQKSFKLGIIQSRRVNNIFLEQEGQA